MKKYSIYVTLHASTFIEVEAKNKKEAIGRALECASEPSLCHQCSGIVQIDSVNDNTETWEAIEIK